MPRWSRNSISANADLDPMNMHPAIIAALHIIFARPDQFHWRATQPLGNRCSFALDMRIGSSAATKASARHLGVERDLLWFQAKDCGNRQLIDGLKLRPSPNLSAITIELNRGVQRLHRRVGKEGEFIFSRNPICR